MARLNWATGAMLLAVAATGFAAPADSGQTDLGPVQLGQAFVLQPGQSVAVAGTATGMQVGFERVLADSRCPKGAHCIWAGDAVARVWLERPTRPRQTGELHTTPGQANVLTAGGHSLTLMRLDPAPIIGQTTLPNSYRATLKLEAISAASDSLMK